MATFQSSLDRIRHYLRDLDGDVWTDDFILSVWNEMQVEFSQRSGLMEKVVRLWWPPHWDYATSHDSERGLVTGDSRQFTRYNSDIDWSCCFLWEPIYNSTSAPPAEEGDMHTQPFETTTAAPSLMPSGELDIVVAPAQEGREHPWPFTHSRRMPLC